MGTKLTKAPAAPTLADATDMVWHKTTIRVYPVTSSQLDELIAGYNSLSLVFLGICFGAALTLGIACRQTTANAAEKPYYLVGCIAAVILAVFFGVHGIGGYVRASTKKSKLYKEAIPLEK
jgi:hypothetical protein